MRNVCGNAYLSGADTVESKKQHKKYIHSLHKQPQTLRPFYALQNFALAMALHRDVQKKSQKELDEVLGGQCLPTFSDSDQKLSIPLGNHDLYEGYEIPKGSVMVPNVYALLHDTEIFIPERFMKGNGPQFPDVDMAFGFGRQVCPGKLLARDTLWIIAAHMLAAYDILGAVDMGGIE
ncbi:hypothetical protein D9758_014327 [Tetrapyrgos nigripes]|uniref:Cytochrome P450 n=1 Tax=Tetrapyrgos nigripes TaxID=182062 RepID=A0A8H5FI20_9AGAR|nr:hypothetical protein D9758_014327 [Tetrapyrgos nigripes]